MEYQIFLRFFFTLQFSPHRSFEKEHSDGRGEMTTQTVVGGAPPWLYRGIAWPPPHHHHHSRTIYVCWVLLRSCAKRPETRITFSSCINFYTDFTTGMNSFRKQTNQKTETRGKGDAHMEQRCRLEARQGNYTGYVLAHISKAVSKRVRRIDVNKCIS